MISFDSIFFGVLVTEGVAVFLNGFKCLFKNCYSIRKDAKNGFDCKGQFKNHVDNYRGGGFMKYPHYKVKLPMRGGGYSKILSTWFLNDPYCNKI